MQNKETKKTESAPKQKGYYFLAFLVFGLICLIALISYSLLNNSQDIKRINAKIGNDTYVLEVSDTESTRQKGLSERDGLQEKTGMLFDFGVNGDWRMWMVQMRFPIDIVWLTADKQVVYIKNNATPAEYPEVYKAEELSRYVIELPSGTAQQLGIQKGDYISFEL